MALMLVLRLFALTWMGMNLSPLKLAARKASETSAAVAGTSREPQAKNTADNAPTNAATNTLPVPPNRGITSATRSEEHTSELQSRLHLVCRLLLEKKKQ